MGGSLPVYFIIIIVLLFPLFVSADADFASAEADMMRGGAVTGRITDAETGEYLIGATVFIREVTIGTATDRYGSFRLNNVPEGKYIIEVSYLGFKTKEVEVEVIAGQRVTVNTSLQESFLTMGEVVVTGVMRGQARAFNVQKESGHVMNVISSEQIERFPDNNVMEAVKRIPGVAVDVGRGEADAIHIRGLPASFHSVTINNQRLASTDNETRESNIGIINSDVVSAIEVSKTITPDMDADAVSGSINLVTKMPVGEERILNLTAGSGYNRMSQQPQWIGSATYGERSNKLSWVLSANYQYDDREAEDVRHDWGVQDFGSGNVDVLAGLRPSLYQTQKRRAGATGQLEYSISERSNLYFMGTFNNFVHEEIRTDVRHGIDNGDYVSPTLVEGARYEKQSRKYRRITDLYSFNAGGQHDIGSIIIDYNVGYSYGSFDVPFREYYHFRHADKPDYNLDISNREFGQISFANDFNPNDYEKMRVRYYEFRRDDSNDNDFYTTLNLTVPYNLAGYSAHVKFGGKYWQKNKNRDYNRRRFSWDGDDNLTMAMFAIDEDRWMIEDRYNLYGFVNWDTGYDFFNNNRNLFKEDINRSRERSDPSYWEASETVLAGYALTDITFGKLNVNAGVRMEQVFTNYKGNRVVFDDDGDWQETVPVESDGDYINFFPMLNLRYNIDGASNLRFAFTNTISRPEDFEWLVPFELVETEDMEMSRGNPDLEPSTSMNLDLMYEKFLANVGLLSAGVFYKNMDKFIYMENTIVSGGPYDGFLQSMPVNGESATIWGIELAWQQQLTFLPGALSGLGVYANYSYIESDAKIVIPDERRIALPQQAPHIFNIALSYDWKGFSGQISYNYRDTWLHSVGGSTSAPSISQVDDVFLDRYFKAIGQLDLVLSYNFTDNLRIFANFNNLTNQSHSHYFYDPIYPYRSSFHGWWSNMGLRYSL